MRQILECYPFSDASVRIAEGFITNSAATDGQPGLANKGIDYILKSGPRFHSFPVYNMMEGEVHFGINDNWGKFVAVRRASGGYRYDVIYAHLKTINPKLQQTAYRAGVQAAVPAGFLLGESGATGDTKGFNRLHIELHRKNLETGIREKLDPYGVYDTISSGKYPQPGQSLAGLEHFWTEDNPALVE